MFVTAAIAGGILCGLFCPSGHINHDTTDPTIICPFAMRTYYAAKKDRRAQVRYNMAVGNDDRKHLGEVKQSSPTHLRSGSFWPPQDHVVSFMVKDASGNVATCDVNFRVVVRVCEYPKHPNGGDLSCETPPGHLPVYGETCQFICDPGYELIGATHTECGREGQWNTVEGAFCKILTCPEPSIPENTKLTSCTDNYNYNSVCMFSCLPGFSLPEGSERVQRCGADQNWKGVHLECRDSQSPVIENCPESQIVHADANADYAIVTWDKPTATDNLDPDVTVVKETGPPPGSQFSVFKVYHISYGARDRAGNFAQPCEFIVDVRQTTCPLVPSSFRMTIECPDVIVYGSVCKFKCENGYALIGSSEARCERASAESSLGYWDWGPGLTAPRCNVRECRELDPPKNGKIKCGPFPHGMSCTMSCDDLFSFPRTVTANQQFVCQDTQGTWKPSPEVPDCTRLHPGDKMVMPTQMSYQTDDCTTEESQNHIKQKVTQQLKQFFEGTRCNSFTSCKADNVKVRCGDATKRGDLNFLFERNSGTNEIKVFFDFVLVGTYNSALSSTEMDNRAAAEFERLGNVFMNDVQNGNMDISGLILNKNSVEFGEATMLCEEGALPEYRTFACLVCSLGTSYKAEKDNCENCEVGTYQPNDGELACIPCPDGMSTRVVGARSLSQCLKTCLAGKYSDDGFVPCKPCPEDTYTDDRKQKECLPCPTGTYTFTIGADSRSDCVKKVIPDGACESNPCWSNGECVKHSEGYKCICTGGYSGTNCELAPDPCRTNGCQNEAKCVAFGQSEDDYNCQCGNLFTGKFCQHRRVHGGWGEWTEWTPCDSSCGDGYEHRYRRCDSPSPNAYGDNCLGETTETRSCNLEECRECPELKTPYKASKVCVEKANGMQVCTVQCSNGILKEVEKPVDFRCGPATDYTWIPHVDPSTIVICTEARFPSHAESILSVKFHAPSSSLQEHDVIKDNVLSTASTAASCIRNKECIANVQIEATEDNQNVAVMTLTVEAELDEYDFMEDGVYNNDTAFEGLHHVLSLEDQLEKITDSVSESVRNGELLLPAGGVTYEPLLNTLLVVGDVRCAPGEAAVQLLCVHCPPGSYGDGTDCELCPVGKYQMHEGQSSCMDCPGSAKTRQKGTVNIDDCIPKKGDSKRKLILSRQNAETSIKNISLIEEALRVLEDLKLMEEI